MTVALYITLFLSLAALAAVLWAMRRRRRSHPVETITGLPNTELNRRAKVARRTP